jgi:hypothetical protein
MTQQCQRVSGSVTEGLGEGVSQGVNASEALPNTGAGAGLERMAPDPAYVRPACCPGGLTFNSASPTYSQHLTDTERQT